MRGRIGDAEHTHPQPYGTPYYKAHFSQTSARVRTRCHGALVRVGTCVAGARPGLLRLLFLGLAKHRARLRRGRCRGRSVTTWQECVTAQCTGTVDVSVIADGS